MILIVASQAGIGTGEPFQMPSVEGAGGLLWSWLQVRAVPEPSEIVLPAGAPGPLCLYAGCRPGQPDALTCLGNAGPDALAEVVVKTHTVDLQHDLSSKPGKLRWAEGYRSERRKTEACDLNLRSCHPLDAAWVAFRPVP